MKKYRLHMMKKKKMNEEETHSWFEVSTASLRCEK